ncbi:MAG TPA: DUF1727 domain-containing protein [Clostridiales bacterium]|nr:DUF1727 domain-containing protein [Clostridiales bacterium]
MRTRAAIITAKFLVLLLRKFGRGGTSLPGKAALWIQPDLLQILTLPLRIILVTGTNGKTTTARIISEILDRAGISHISNRSGSNLLNGIAAMLVEKCSLKGSFSADTALLELDEAAFRLACTRMRPHAVVVTNFFRDQLDRYGELYSTLNAVREGLAHTGPDTALILNADDSLCTSLAKDSKGPVFFYGVEASAVSGDPAKTDLDALHCIYCGSRYAYAHRTYGHLGGFCCPGCGYSRPGLQVACTRILREDTGGMSVDVNLRLPGQEEQTIRMDIALPGLYNLYNALAAAGCGFALNLPVQAVTAAVARFQSGFGRMETLNCGDRQIKLILVKNPAGFNQVLAHLAPVKAGLHAAFLLNDNIADGTDVSWIWDVDFESFSDAPGIPARISVCGRRKWDMALRLKYSGFDEGDIHVEPSYSQLIQNALGAMAPGECLTLLPTYTAMLTIRRELSKHFSLPEFWA